MPLRTLTNARLVLGAAVCLLVVAVLSALVELHWARLYALDREFGAAPYAWTVSSPLTFDVLQVIELAFGTVALTAVTTVVVVVLLVRRHVPESPRWLFIHGREDEAERIVREIEEEVRRETSADVVRAACATNGSGTDRRSSTANARRTQPSSLVTSGRVPSRRHPASLRAKTPEPTIPSRTYGRAVQTR